MATYRSQPYTFNKVLNGINGSNGNDGKGIKTASINYQVSTNGVTAPTGTWLTSIPSVSPSQYLWTRILITYTDNTTSTAYSVGLMGANGSTGPQGPQGPSGTAGIGIKNIANYYLASSLNSGVTTSTSGWTSTIQTISSTNKYLWNYEVISYTNNTGYTTTPCIIGAYGETGSKGDTGNTGNGINSITEYYAISTSNTTAPTSWLTTVPIMTETNKYLWNYEVFAYTNGTSKETTKRVIGVYGDRGSTGSQGPTGPQGPTGASGKGIKSTVVDYQVSSSGTTVPTGTWSTTIPSITDNQFMWTRTTITYTDNATSTSYSIGKAGAKGSTGATGSAGRGVKSTAVTYQASTSGTKVPTSTWVTTIPSVSASQYLWTRTIITYTDDTTSTSYSIGMMGATGGKGDKGDTGVGVKSIVTQYYLSTSKTTQTGGSWNTAQPTWSPNKYIWTRSLITWDSGSTSTTTPVIATVLNDAFGNIVSLDNVILAWCMNNDKTYINGSKIYAKSITSSQLSTDAIKSNNYVANSVGSFLNLADGSFDSKYLKWTSEGVLTATSGYIAGIKINATSLTSSQTSGSIVKGYEITNSGSISTYNKGSGRDYWLYLTANSMQLKSQTTAGSVPLEMNLTDSLLSFKSSSTQIAYAKATMDGLELWGINEVRSKSNFYSTNIYADNVPTAGTLGQGVTTFNFGSLKDYPCFIGSVYQTDDTTWFNTISVRHRNGLEDGNQYGMFIRSKMQTTTASLVWNQQYGGAWGSDRTILDSANVGSYAYPTLPTGIANGHNLNNVTLIGQYQINVGSNYVNGPSTYLDGVMFIPVNINGAMILQIYVHYDGTTYNRIYWHGSWRGWKRIDNG